MKHIKGRHLWSKGFSVIEVTFAILLIALIFTASSWIIYHHYSHTTKTIISSSNDALNPTPTVVSTADHKLSISLPNTWHILGNNQVITADRGGPGCIDVDDPDPCIYGATFQPKALSSTTGPAWYLTVEKTDWTISQASYSLLGELNSQNTAQQSTAPINGYSALYVKVRSSGSSVGDYVDIHYFIEKDGYLVHFSNREQFNNHTNDPDRWDNSVYSPNFASIVKSLRINF